MHGPGESAGAAEVVLTDDLERLAEARRDVVVALLVRDELGPLIDQGRCDPRTPERPCDAASARRVSTQ